MTKIEILTLVALFSGPTIAVQVQKFIEGRTEVRNRKIWIFKTLMSTRSLALRLSPQHIQALNMIDIEFYKGNKQEQKVIDLWKRYLDCLNECPQNADDQNYQSLLSIWTNKRDDLFVDLLYEMSQALNYNFDKVLLKKGIYSPKGPFDAEQEQMFVRQGFLEVLKGNKRFPISVHDYTQIKQETE